MIQLVAIDLPIDLIHDYCQDRPIRRLSLFGSVFRADFRGDSDIDMLIEFSDSAQMSLFDLGKIQMELSELIQRPVDLKTTGFLGASFRQKIIDTAIPIYERE
jgi:uncharacterized protein